MIYTETSVTKHLEAFCRDHLGRHDSPAYWKYHDLHADLLREKRAEQREEHSNGAGFGMSKAGDCMRAAAFKRAGIAGAEPSGSERATWEIGHSMEVMALALLMASGFEVTDRQARVRVGPFESAIDGVVRSGPVPLPYPLILSVKSSGYKMGGFAKGRKVERRGFAALPLDGIASQATWYAQSQLEMGVYDYPLEYPGAAEMGAWPRSTLFLVVAKDMIKAFEGDEIMQASGSLTFYAEVVTYDGVTAPGLVQQYGEVLDTEPHMVPARTFRAKPRPEMVTLPEPGDVASGWGGPNREATGTFNPCRGCGFAAICGEGK